jgi:hypothetical protein
VSLQAGLSLFVAHQSLFYTLSSSLKIQMLAKRSLKIASFTIKDFVGLFRIYWLSDLALIHPIVAPVQLWLLNQRYMSFSWRSYFYS